MTAIRNMTNGNLLVLMPAANRKRRSLSSCSMFTHCVRGNRESRVSAEETGTRQLAIPRTEGTLRFRASAKVRQHVPGSLQPSSLLEGQPTPLRIRFNVIKHLTDATVWSVVRGRGSSCIPTFVEKTKVVVDALWLDPKMSDVGMSHVQRPMYLF